ncbi:MAG: DUF1804 family protein [Leptolyngbya sp. SIO1E4]|nr:DUF1804 family protein [Leptolyngbya sp. SIO1E4]
MAQDKREQAKALLIKGITISEIARRLDVARRTVQRWIAAAKEAGDDWEALRDGLPQPERPKVVTFERPRDRHSGEKPRTPTAIAAGEYDTLAGQLRAIDEMLDIARREAGNPTSVQSYGAALNGFCRLLEQRNKLRPVGDEEYLAELLTRYRTPHELVARLKEAGWGRSA